MRLFDYIPHVAILRTQSSCTEALAMRLKMTGCEVSMIDLDHPSLWRAALLEAARAADRDNSPGIILMSADHEPSNTLWMSLDAMVERLETSHWRALYIGHDSPVHTALNFARSGWIHCDAPPDEVSALGLRCELIGLLTQDMPDPVDKAKQTPSDWFTMASWLMQPTVGCSHALAAWPPLVRGKVTHAVAEAG